MSGLNQKDFLLVSGDFSGIQDTVYSISSKGALKSLRARSFMLELLTEHIVYEILKLAGLYIQSPEDYENYLIRRGKEIGVVYSGGGGFSLLLHYDDKLKSNIEDFAFVLNEWAINEFFGKLFIGIHAQPISKDDIQGESFLKARQIQADALDKLKRRKFNTKYGGLLAKMLIPQMPAQTTNERECQITRRDDLPNNKMKKINEPEFWVSQLSFNLLKFGDKLTDLKVGSKIYRYEYNSANIEELKGCLCFPKPNHTNAFYDIITEGNQPDPHREKYWEIGKDFFYAYYVTKVGDLSEYGKEVELTSAQEDNPVVKMDDIKDNYTASFSGLAACSCGANMIGALRMDVDDLGHIFSSDKIDSISKLAEMSYQLNYFFKSCLNEICEGKTAQFSFGGTEFSFEPVNILKPNIRTGKKVSIIYAGGDDLFIVGAWNEIVELSIETKVL